MAQIYARAKEVLVWLGDAGARVKQALGVIQILRWRGQWKSPSDAINFSLGLSKTIASSFWKATSIIYHDLYWTRLWIVQELVNARKATLVLGTTHCSLLHYLWFSVWEPNYKRTSDYVGRLMGSGGLRPSRPPNALSLVRSLKAPDYKWHKACRFKTLDYFIIRFGHLECEDKHDKVFAFLGMVKGYSAFKMD
jgi:hypothetical protein